MISVASALISGLTPSFTFEKITIGSVVVKVYTKALVAVGKVKTGPVPAGGNVVLSYGDPGSGIGVWITELQ